MGHLLCISGGLEKPSTPFSLFFPLLFKCKLEIKFSSFLYLYFHSPNSDTGQGHCLITSGKLLGFFVFLGFGFGLGFVLVSFFL